MGSQTLKMQRGCLNVLLVGKTQFAFCNLMICQETNLRLYHKETLNNKSKETFKHEICS